MSEKIDKEVIDFLQHKADLIFLVQNPDIMFKLSPEEFWKALSVNPNIPTTFISRFTSSVEVFQVA